MSSSRFGTKLLLILVLVIAPLALGYRQQTGTYSQPTQTQQGTSPQRGVQLRPSDADTEIPSAPETAVAPGIGNTTQPLVRRSAGWPWLLLGLAIGFILGMAFRKPASTVVREDVRKDVRDDIHDHRDRAA